MITFIFPQVTLTSKGIRLLVPSCNDPSEIVNLDIQLNEIVKFIFHFSPGLNVLFLYNFKKCSDYIRESLDMKPKTSGGAVESKSAKSTFPYKTKTICLQLLTITQRTFWNPIKE